MAIKVRRGNEADFDKNKMQEGEFAAILDSEKVVISFGNGRVKELAGKEELDSAIKQLTNTTSSAIICNATGANLTISDCSALPFQAVRLKGNSQQDSSPSPLYPQSINSAVVSEVKVRGKNLIPYPYSNASATIYGVEWIVNDDGSITANGTATEHSYFMVKYMTHSPLLCNINPDVTYVLSGCPEGGAEWTYCQGMAIYDENKITLGYVLDTGSSASFNFSEKFNKDVGYVYVWLRIGKGVTVENATFKPMIRSAKVADNTFELYKENAITLSEPIELNGIGSARDEVADSKKIRRFVQEVITEARSMDSMNLLASIPLSHAPKGVSDGNIVGNFLCDKLPANSLTMVRKSNLGIAGYSNTIFIRNADIEQTVGAYNAWLAENPITVMYELSEPVVTDIPTEDVIALNSLHGYKPITYISTDSEVQAIIDVDYVADTKTYIDNRLAIRAQAQEEALLNMLLLMPEAVQASMIENDTNNLLNESEV